MHYGGYVSNEDGSLSINIIEGGFGVIVTRHSNGAFTCNKLQCTYKNNFTECEHIQMAIAVFDATINQSEEAIRTRNVARAEAQIAEAKAKIAALEKILPQEPTPELFGGQRRIVLSDDEKI